MPNAELKIDFLAGVDLQSAIIEARKLCGKLDLAYVKFDFNGVHIAVRQRGDIGAALNKYNSGEEHNHIIV